MLAEIIQLLRRIGREGVILVGICLGAAFFVGDATGLIKSATGWEVDSRWYYLLVYLAFGVIVLWRLAIANGQPELLIEFLTTKAVQFQDLTQHPGAAPMVMFVGRADGYESDHDRKNREDRAELSDIEAELHRRVRERLIESAPSFVAEWIATEKARAQDKSNALLEIIREIRSNSSTVR